MYSNQQTDRKQRPAGMGCHSHHVPVVQDLHLKTFSLSTCCCSVCTFWWEEKKADFPHYPAFHSSDIDFFKLANNLKDCLICEMKNNLWSRGLSSQWQCATGMPHRIKTASAAASSSWIAAAWVHHEVLQHHCSVPPQLQSSYCAPVQTLLQLHKSLPRLGPDL